MTKKMENLKRTVYVAILFFAVTVPFRELFRVSAVTEMRPAGALPPVLGLMLGLPGALGCAIGNLAADIISGYSPVICALGFGAQFIYGFLPFCMWKIITHLDKNESPLLRLDSVKNVIRYVVIILINSLVMSVALGSIMQTTGTGAFFSAASLMIFFNDFIFSMVLGIPIIILMSVLRLKAGNMRLSLNERLVLFFLSLGVISAGLIGAFAYIEFSHIIDAPLAMWNRVYLYIAANLAVVNIVTVVFLWYIEKNITAPVETVAGLAKNYISAGKEKKDSLQIADRCGQLSKTNTEAGILAGAFREMVLDIDAYVDNLTKATAEKERIGAELRVAAHIQASMLPGIFPAFPERQEFDIFAVMIPAKEVGGDFYDFFLIDENKLAVVMADVSGKGVPAALFMVIAKTLIKSNAQAGKSPKEVFETVNYLLCQNNDEGMFVTAFIGYFHMDTGKFVYVNAGHNPPLIKKAGGRYEYLSAKPSLMLAFMEDAPYKEGELDLNRGDIIYLYTDGVTEATNPEEDLFGEQRLAQALDGTDNMPLEETLKSVKMQVDAFANGAEQADDITMLALVVNKLTTERIS